MSPLFISRAAIGALLAATLPAGRVSAQAAERVGDFSVEVLTDSATGEDRSFATLWPEGGYLSLDVSTGLVSVACGRDSAALAGNVMLPAGGAAGDTVLVTVGFGEETPDTLVLEGGEEVSNQWYFRDQDVASVFRRAHGADSLRLQLLSASTPGERTRFTYGLAGVDTVLSRLGCVVAPPGPGRRAGRRILGSMQTVEASAVVYPRITNRGDFVRYLERHYPPELRGAGVEGDVTVRFRVMEDGGVDSASVQVLRSTNAALDATAVGAVRLMRFRAASAYGRPIKLWIEQPIHMTPPGRPARSRSSP